MGQGESRVSIACLGSRSQSRVWRRPVPPLTAAAASVSVTIIIIIIIIIIISEKMQMMIFIICKAARRDPILAI